MQQLYQGETIRDFLAIHRYKTHFQKTWIENESKLIQQIGFDENQAHTVGPQDQGSETLS